MHEAQKGTCSICDMPISLFEKGFTASVDHDHETGVIRNLLCKLCNAGLGHFKDSTKLLEKAVQYLKCHKEVQVG